MLEILTASVWTLARSLDKRPSGVTDAAPLDRGSSLGPSPLSLAASMRGNFDVAWRGVSPSAGSEIELSVLGEAAIARHEARA